MAKPIVSGLFGLVVIASGFWRYLSADGGHTGLWFGIVMGSIAVVGSVMLWTRRHRFGNLLSGCSILLVGGWFGYEALIKKGIANAEPRQLVVIVIAIVSAAALIYFSLPARSDEPS